jgi:hypothetical protein
VTVAPEEYELPTVPVPAGQVSVIGCGGGAMVIEHFEVVMPVVLPGTAVESAAWAVKLNVPAVLGVPVIAPVTGFRVRPGGSEPAMIENV